MSSFKSGFERTVSIQLSQAGVEWDYEQVKLPYTLEGTYNPDFRLLKSGILIEVKGFLDRESKRKMVAVKKAHPSIDIRFCFSQSDKKIPGSKQTHGEWARKNGFPYCEGSVPQEWLDEE